MAEEGVGQAHIETTEIDGVTVLWAPDARRTAATIQFRVGRADEPFAQMGISHLVEHLALFPVGRRLYETNGSVDHIRTALYAAGTADENAAFLGDVCDHLAALPTKRLAHEERILRTEAAHRSPRLFDLLLWYRCGAAGFGKLGLAEFGLGQIDAATVTAWSREHYTTGNAVVWFAGELPATLRFGLPTGERRVTPDLVPIEPLPTPAWLPIPSPGIGVGMVVPRSSAINMALRIVTYRLEQRLRYDLGKSYDISTLDEAIGRDLGHAAMFASCLEWRPATSGRTSWPSSTSSRRRARRRPSSRATSTASVARRRIPTRCSPISTGAPSTRWSVIRSTGHATSWPGCPT